MTSIQDLHSPGEDPHPPAFSRLPVVSVLLLLAAFILSGCSDEMDRFIQGRWAVGDVHTWSEWNFDRGTYTYYFDYDNNRTNTFESGWYNIIESGEDYLVIELFNQQGAQVSFEERVEVRINIDVEEDTISIRQRKFYRVSNSSLEALATARSE